MGFAIARKSRAISQPILRVPSDRYARAPKRDNQTLKEENTMTGNSLKQALLAAVALIALSAPLKAQSGIPGVLAPGVVSELVQEGFVFTEGPVGAPDGSLYFSDIRANNGVGRTHHLDSTGKIATVREPTNGANGLALTKDGELLFAEGSAKRITKRSRDGAITTVIDNHAGQPM